MFRFTADKRKNIQHRFPDLTCPPYFLPASFPNCSAPGPCLVHKFYHRPPKLGNVTNNPIVSVTYECEGLKLTENLSKVSLFYLNPVTFTPLLTRNVPSCDYIPGTFAILVGARGKARMNVHSDIHAMFLRA